MSDRAWLDALLTVEGALARAQARVGLIPAADAEAIASACETADLDIAAIGREAAESGTPVLPLVRRLRELVGNPLARSVHHGATSQDILDTASMLVGHRALGVIVGDVAAASDATAGLAREHRNTPIAGRTLLQQALPTTFGLKAAGWMIGLDEAITGLARVRRERLAVQLGGPVGTLAGFGNKGPALVTAFAEELGLAEPVLPWHTQRNRIAELASALGLAAGAVAKPARDIVLLAQTEVGEVREGVPGRGGSSAMPHKNNPIAAVSALAGAQQAPGLVATILALMAHEHERAAGSWHAEWLPLRELLRTVGSAAAWLGDSLSHLEVDAAAMAANLERGAEALRAKPGDLEAACALVDRALAAHDAATSRQ
jgi:3-carboxy-cis,cis-muconate cycloisomerase